MNSHLKALGSHVYLATTKSFYINNRKYTEGNAQALIALRQSLSKENISLISYYDSAFIVWNTLTSPKEQMTNVLEKEPIVDESEQTCYIVQ